jgi:hypothetical protein
MWNPGRCTPSPPPAPHALPALYQAAATGLPTLAGPGREGAGIGILIPVKQPAGGQQLDVDTRTRNAIQRSLRCLGERGFALLTGRWFAVTVNPSFPFASRFVGDYSGIATTPDHVAAYWTDMRATACLNRCGAAENTYFASVP